MLLLLVLSCELLGPLYVWYVCKPLHGWMDVCMYRMCVYVCVCMHACMCTLNYLLISTMHNMCACVGTLHTSHTPFSNCDKHIHTHTHTHFSSCSDRHPYRGGPGARVSEEDVMWDDRWTGGGGSRARVVVGGEGRSVEWRVAEGCPHVGAALHLLGWGRRASEHDGVVSDTTSGVIMAASDHGAEGAGIAWDWHSLAAFHNF